jgi:Fe-Mn family superoxide dismutase
MPYRIQSIRFKPSRLRGLSSKLIASHYENNYGGAVRRLNTIERELAQLDMATAPGFVVNGLKREALIAYNSMVLHEIYFDSLGGEGEPTGALARALETDFGSVAAWRREFVAMGKALAGGSGWVLLAFAARDGRLVNQWAADHTHVLADGRPILALDMYEHAYHIDFGANAGAYVDAFMQNVDWVGAETRFARVAGDKASAAAAPAAVPAVPVEDVRAMIERKEDVLVLDVRPAKDYEADKVVIPGALRRDPEKVEEWAKDVPKDKPVLLYCNFGLSVSQDAAAALRQKGVDAAIVGCGIAGWRAIGGAVRPKS